MENISLDNFQENFNFRAEHVDINGFLSKQGVANFLGIPYAQFPARFRTARRVDLDLLDGQLDASRYGPRCPQKTDNIHPMMHQMFEKLSTSQRCDETTCLHLNIYAPPQSVGATGHSDLPVFVWIHGGGFNNGDNTTEFGRFQWPEPLDCSHSRTDPDIQMATILFAGRWTLGCQSLS